MNHSLLERGNRYARKRNSHQVSKSSHTIKNGKRALPEVFIDLNNHKKYRLILQQKNNKHKPQSLQTAQFGRHNEVRKGQLRAAKKKDNVVLKHLYNTELLKPSQELVPQTNIRFRNGEGNLRARNGNPRLQDTNEGNVRLQMGSQDNARIKVGSRDSNTRDFNVITNQGRLYQHEQNRHGIYQQLEKFSLLKLENERLKSQNEKIKINQAFLQQKIKQLKQQHQLQMGQKQDLHHELCLKLEDYAHKIKTLFRELISEKKRGNIHTQQRKTKLHSHQSNQNDAGYINQNRVIQQEDPQLKQNDPGTLNSDSNRYVARPEVQSYRLGRQGEDNYYASRQGEDNYHTETNKAKKLSSPSYYSLGKKKPLGYRWEEHRIYLRHLQQKGEQQYYQHNILSEDQL